MVGLVLNMNLLQFMKGSVSERVMKSLSDQKLRQIHMF